jgi:prepilin peptidase CpaA
MLSEAVGLTLFPGVMAFAAASDLLTMTIANRVSIVLIAGFVLLAALSGTTTAVLASHIAAGIVVLAAAFVCFARGWVGGGDAKLASSTALWLGLSHLSDYLLYASVFGGALTLLIMLFRSLPLPNLLAGQQWAEQLHRDDAGVPYGIALAAAALVVYPQTGWMTAIGM